jgi:hypothetical protein
MMTITRELRTNAGITLPCPDYGAECRPDYVTKLQRQTETPVSTVVLPKHYLELTCTECGIESSLRLDAQGYPVQY